MEIEKNREIEQGGRSYRTYQIRIKPGHRLYAYFDDLCFKAKNLYNIGNYYIRQAMTGLSKVDGCLHENEVKAINEMNTTIPRMNQARIAYAEKRRITESKKPLEERKETEERLSIGKLGCIEGKFKEARVVPSANCYVVEIVMEVTQIEFAERVKKRIFGIDMGVNNFATIVNNIGLPPMLVKGGIVKSINQYYNKQRAAYYSILRKGKDSKSGPFSSMRLRYLVQKRNSRIKDFCHKASRAIIDDAVKHDIDTIIVGKNIGQKQEVNIGRVNNQNFVNLPHGIFLKQLEYKAKAVGINFVVTEESYTSKASFIDNDQIPVYKKDTLCDYNFSGKRIKRGLYRSKDGLIINADVNGAGNIIRKVVPDAFVAEGIVAVVTPPRPLILKGFYEKTQKILKDNGITKKLPAQCAA